MYGLKDQRPVSGAKAVLWKPHPAGDNIFVSIETIIKLISLETVNFSV